MPTALIFPGQGAPAPEWREAAGALRPALVERAAELVGEDPFERFGEGTELDQPAIYCASVAALASAGIERPELCAGHSLGEVAALVAAGALSELDGLRVVVERGRLMAATIAADEQGAMLAVRSAAEPLAALAAERGAVLANLNSPEQTVLSGPAPAIEALAAELGERRIRCKRLPVAGAFHSPRMSAAAPGLAELLAGIELRPPRATVISGRTARPFTDPRAELVAALSEPVRWVDVVAALERRGADRYLEVGPGKALTGLVRRIADRPAVERVPVPEAAGA